MLGLVPALLVGKDAVDIVIVRWLTVYFVATESVRNAVGVFLNLVLMLW